MERRKSLGKKITAEEAKETVNLFHPGLGYDTMHKPIFPKGRRDICLVMASRTNGRDYGYDVACLVQAHSCNTILKIEGYLVLEKFEMISDEWARIKFKGFDEITEEL